jgi:hypothetical protein
MTTTKLHGSLPADDDKNGLAGLGKAVQAERRKTFLVVALVSGYGHSENYDDDSTTVWLRVRHAEVVPEDQRPIVAEVLFQALSARTGALMLPIEPGEDYMPGSQATGDEGGAA